MREISIVKSKILEYLDYKGISKYEFYKNTGVSNGILSQKSKLSEDTIMKFLSYYRDVNPSWLLRDQGKMLKDGEYLSGDHRVPDRVPGAEVPYYDIDAAAGPVTIFSDSPEIPNKSISIPGFEDCDLALNVWGDSMQPIYNAGEVVICKKVKDKRIILYGEAYLVITEELRVIKYLQPGNDDRLIVLCSEDSFYKDVQIPRDSILHLYLVKGKVKRNAI